MDRLPAFSSYMHRHKMSVFQRMFSLVFICCEFHLKFMLFYVMFIVSGTSLCTTYIYCADCCKFVSVLVELTMSFDILLLMGVTLQCLSSLVCFGFFVREVLHCLHVCPLLYVLQILTSLLKILLCVCFACIEYMCMTDV